MALFLLLAHSLHVAEVNVTLIVLLHLLLGAGALQRVLAREAIDVRRVIITRSGAHQRARRRLFVGFLLGCGGLSCLCLWFKLFFLLLG